MSNERNEMKDFGWIDRNPVPGTEMNMAMHSVICVPLHYRVQGIQILTPSKGREGVGSNCTQQE